MTRDDFRRQADRVRVIPLEVVLTAWGAARDRRDTSRWRTSRGPLSVTGTKFFNWHACQGGGGAIDLVMHLGDCDAREAIEWLGRHLGYPVHGANATTRQHTEANPALGARSTPGRASAASDRGALASRRDDKPARGRRHPRLHLPAASPENLPRVCRYLTEQRGLSPAIVASLIEQGTVYADARGNAVFLMVTGKPNRPIGAELRGTGHRRWRGLAPGTSKSAGYFWIGPPGSTRILLCESAIDAISGFQLATQRRDASLPGPCICISTAGVRSDAPWLYPLLTRGYHIYCGFDADEPGDSASRHLIGRHRSIQRLRPPQHDWNALLIARTP